MWPFTRKTKQVSARSAMAPDRSTDGSIVPLLLMANMTGSEANCATSTDPTTCADPTPAGNSCAGASNSCGGASSSCASST